MKLLILDRDGVINHESADFIKSPEEWAPIKGSLEAIARLSQAGYDIVVITNQSGVGRGLFSADTLGQIHVRMIDHVRQHGGRIQSILFCPHTPDDDCQCRKPNDGMYQELAKRLNMSFQNIISIGDSLRDLQAAKKAGAIPVLVKTGNGRKSAREIEKNGELGLADTPIFDSLAHVADAILTEQI